MPLTTATEPLRTFRHCNTHAFMQDTATRNWSWEMIMGFEALYAGRGRRNPVWSGKEAHWSLRGLIVKSAEHCGADYKPLDRNHYSNQWWPYAASGCDEKINGTLLYSTHRQVSDIRRTLVGNKIVYHSDVVGASPVATAPTTSSFST